ncbi:hypothetical protein [Pseudomonas sp. LA5]|uniref:hypothetical protein n=1 Tax=Pseudomonas sp. LA5 TaxID=3027850 RepID=UPI00235F9101|nr:hypothetical protein [Pseudomonas sp. LA5]
MNIIGRAQTNAQRLAILIPACIAGGYLLGLVHPYIPQDKSIIPAGMIAVIAAPISIAVSLLSKLGDVNKLKSFSRTERRRLEPMIDRKSVAIHRLIFLYSILSILVGLGLFFASVDSGITYALGIYRAVGASIAFTMISSLMLLAEHKRATDFEAKVINRSNHRKQKAALLKKLETKTD